MRIGFTGTQAGMTHAQSEALRGFWLSLFAGNPRVELHHGDCIGADAQAHDLWVRDAPERLVVIHPPSLDTKRARRFSGNVTILPAAPYLARNRAIVDAAWLLCACPREATGETLRSGTWSTVRYARRIGRDVVIVRPDGGVHLERHDALGERAWREAP